MYLMRKSEKKWKLTAGQKGQSITGIKECWNQKGIVLYCVCNAKIKYNCKKRKERRILNFSFLDCPFSRMILEEEEKRLFFDYHFWKRGRRRMEREKKEKKKQRMKENLSSFLLVNICLFIPPLFFFFLFFLRPIFFPIIFLFFSFKTIQQQNSVCYIILLKIMFWFWTVS